MKKIFVTGGTGFIGSHLVARLIQRGYAVRAMTRKPLSTLNSMPNVEFVPGDLTDVESLRRGMEGCQYVFHLAAYAKNWARNPKTYDRLNVQATEDIFALALQDGVERLVWTSSIVTLGPTLPGVVGDEKMPRNRATRFAECFTHYERSKTDMERRCVAWLDKNLPLVIVNPTRVYGAERHGVEQHGSEQSGPDLLSESNTVSKMINEYRHGRFPFLLNFGKNIGNYAFVDDVAEGHILALERGQVGERYILGGENASLKELLRLVDQVDGKKRLQIPIAWLVPLALSGGMGLAAKLFGVYPTMTPGWIRTFLADWAFSSHKAETMLGYRVTPLEEGIRRTCRWLSERE